MDIGVRTVGTNKAQGMEKLGLRTWVDLIRYAVARDWLTGG